MGRGSEGVRHQMPTKQQRTDAVAFDPTDARLLTELQEDARLTRAGYALLVALLPATATLIGIVVLGQIPTLGELAGVALVVLGVAVHREAG